MVTRLNPNVDYVWTLHGRPWSPAAAGQVDVFLSTEPLFFDANDATAPNRVYRAWLRQPFSMSRSMFGSGRIIGGISLPSYGAAVMTVGDEFATKRTEFKGYRWTGWPVTIRRGIKGQAHASYTVIHDGLFGAEPDFELTRVPLPLADLQAKLQNPVQTTTYLGTGGFEGGADFLGQYKPDAVGIVRWAEGKVIDPANGWVDYCVSGFHTFFMAYDGAKEVTRVMTNPPGPGECYVDMANGRVRYGTPATFGHRVDFRSNFAGGSTALGTIVSTLLTTRAGFSAGQVNSTAFTQLNTDRSQKVGWYMRDGDTCQQVLDGLLGGAVCFFTTTADGKLTAAAVKAPIATAKTDASVQLVITDREIVPGSFKRRGYAAPPKRLDIRARRNWAPLDAGRLAAAALPADKDFGVNAWRTIPKPNATTAAEFPTSVPLAIETPFDDLTEADAAGTTFRDLLTVPRPPAELTLVHPPFVLELGTEVWIESAVNEVNAPAIVSGLDESGEANTVSLRLWGLDE
jgi:hypothetical protein